MYGFGFLIWHDIFPHVLGRKPSFAFDKRRHPVFGHVEGGALRPGTGAELELVELLRIGMCVNVYIYLYVLYTITIIIITIIIITIIILTSTSILILVAANCYLYRLLLLLLILLSLVLLLLILDIS